MFLVENVGWIISDGWPYGNLDHVLISGENAKAFVVAAELEGEAAWGDRQLTRGILEEEEKRGGTGDLVRKHGVGLPIWSPPCAA
jgi:hypothetical protein